MKNVNLIQSISKFQAMMVKVAGGYIEMLKLGLYSAKSMMKTMNTRVTFLHISTFCILIYLCN